MPLRTVATKAPKPKARAVEAIHKKHGGNAHPHVGHSWDRLKRKVYVKGRWSKSGKWVKGHYKTVYVKSGM